MGDERDARTIEGRRRNIDPLLAGIIGFGLLLRFGLLLHRPYLWVDEAHLAPNVIGRGWATLFTPAVNEQVAPFGYLAIVKLCTLLLGDAALVLRLPSFVAGCLLLLLTPLLARAAGLEQNERLFATLFAAALPELVHYSAEFKQYELEALVALVVLLAAFYAASRSRLRHRLPLFIAGFAGVLLSLSAPIMLGAAAILLLWRDLRARRWPALAATVLVDLGWLALFGWHYLLLRNPATMGKMHSVWWAQAFAPHSLKLPFWIVRSTMSYLKFLSSADMLGTALIGLLVVLGISAAFWRRLTDLLVLALLPVALVWLAAILHLFPFEGRVALFLAPGWVLLLAPGAVAFAKLFRPGLPARAATAAIVAVVALRGTVTAATFHDDALPVVITYVAKHRRPGDLIYVHALALPLWRIYAPRHPELDARNGPVILGRDSRAGTGYLLQDFERLQGRGRVWLVTSRDDDDSKVPNGQGREDEDMLFYLAGIRGHELDHFRRYASAAMLSDLSASAGVDLARQDLPPYRPVHASYDLGQ